MNFGSWVEVEVEVEEYFQGGRVFSRAEVEGYFLGRKNVFLGGSGRIFPKGTNFVHLCIYDTYTFTIHLSSCYGRKESMGGQGGGQVYVWKVHPNK